MNDPPDKPGLLHLALDETGLSFRWPPPWHGRVCLALPPPHLNRGGWEFLRDPARLLDRHGDLTIPVTRLRGLDWRATITESVRAHSGQGTLR